nr:GntR family transcriptional regulator [uncultured Aminipila sp.]
MSKNTSLKEMIYNEVFQSIIKGEYAANDIISEKMLVEKYQVSKSPVREALVELCNEGILRSMPRYGYAVVQLTRNDIENILKYRVILEGGSLRDCIHNITETQLVMLEEIDAACAAHECSCDFFTHWEHNMEFHLKLISFCGNEFSYNMLKKSLDNLTRAYAQFYWNKWNNIEIPTDTKYHVKIIDCLRKNDLEGAIHFLKEDISDFGI